MPKTEIQLNCEQWFDFHCEYHRFDLYSEFKICNIVLYKIPVTVLTHSKWVKHFFSTCALKNSLIPERSRLILRPLTYLLFLSSVLFLVLLYEVASIVCRIWVNRKKKKSICLVTKGIFKKYFLSLIGRFICNQFAFSFLWKMNSEVR